MLREKNFSKYLVYAIGEIVLVVIGILIALNINNWNENRKEHSLMITHIRSMGKEIQNDVLRTDKIISDLELQEVAGNKLIPIMESDQKIISDSLAFILAFNDFTTTPIIANQNNTWNYLNSSGILSEFPDETLLNLLEDYYSDAHSLATNFTNTANPPRLEIRKLKYELFKDTEHRKFFPTATPVSPNKAVYSSILEDERILPLCRYIGSTAIYFKGRFMTSKAKANAIIAYINNKYS